MIVIPMAGLSRRFHDAGYAQPKYMLHAGGKSLFAHSVGSFSHYFDKLPFLFIYRDLLGTDAFVRQQVRDLGIKVAHFVVLEQPTAGQADTVAQGLSQSNTQDYEPITIFNIDTIRLDFRFPSDPAIVAADGFLEVFKGDGDNWSFVGPKPNQPGCVARTTEKDPISDLCSDGLYHFSKAQHFTQALIAAQGANDSVKGEYYVAPLYNCLIAAGLDVRYTTVLKEDIIFSGVPQEYIDFCHQLLRR